MEMFPGMAVLSSDAALGSVRVLVADDRPAYRSALVTALEVVPDVEVVGVVESAEGACRAAVRLRPDVVLLDLSAPGTSDLDATARIRRAAPLTNVVVMTASDGPSFVRSAIAAGATAYVTKEAPLEDVVGVVLFAAERGA